MEKRNKMQKKMNLLLSFSVKCETIMVTKEMIKIAGGHAYEIFYSRIKHRKT